MMPGKQTLYVNEAGGDKKAPWGGIASRIETNTVKGAIKAAKLDWEVRLEQLACPTDGAKVQAYATRRSDTNAVLGTVGNRTTPLQNIEAFNFFEPFIEAGGAKIDLAGSLGGGKKVWILAKIGNGPLKIAKDDVVEKYLLLSNSHDGSTSVRVGFTPIRRVCNNMLASALSSKESQLIRIHHHKNVVQNLQLVQDTVSLANQRFETTAEKYRQLLKKQVSKKDIEKFVHQVFYPQVVDFKTEESERLKSAYAKMNETITKLFERGQGNDLKDVKGTMWALYNGVTEYLSYEAGKSQDSRLTSLWFGANHNLNERALELALVAAR